MFIKLFKYPLIFFLVTYKIFYMGFSPERKKNRSKTDLDISLALYYRCKKLIKKNWCPN